MTRICQVCKVRKCKKKYCDGCRRNEMRRQNYARNKKQFLSPMKDTEGIRMAWL